MAEAIAVGAKTLIQNEDSFSGRPGHPARRFG